MNLVWKKSDCTWIYSWNPGLAKKMYYGYLERFIKSLNNEQKNVLGIPLPNNIYWNKIKIKNYNERYKNFTLSKL